LRLVEHAIAVLEGKRAGNKQWAVEYLTGRMLGRTPQQIKLSAKGRGERGVIYLPAEERDETREVDGMKIRPPAA
jgi:hypothetical protein